MPWELDSDRPIYAQIVDRLKHEIVSGFYPPAPGFPVSATSLHRQASIRTPCRKPSPSWSVPV